MLQELQLGDPQRVGPYRLVGRLGSGGMGRVFLGRSTGGRLVAVKLIHDGLAADPDFRARFGREVAAAKQVGGLFTALVVDADTQAPTPWLATAYVSGPSLADAVSKSGPLPPASVVSLAAGLAEGLAAVHAAGLVHRDLKPSNVLLAEDGPRVIDFGISRAAEASALTHTGSVIGSPGFMSPEQAEGKEVGPASDMFSLGAVLVYAATGVPPFGTGSTAALVFRVVFSPPRLDDVPWQVRPIAERCLDKDPGQRPTPAELLAEFGEVDLAGTWLPTRVLTEFAPPAPPDPARTGSSSGLVSIEHTAQPDAQAAPDAPDTVTTPPNQPQESPTAQPAPAAETTQPWAVETHPTAAPSADDSAVAPERKMPAAPPAGRPPIREGVAVAGAVTALLAGLGGITSWFLEALYPWDLSQPIFYFGLAIDVVIVAAALAVLMRIHRLVITGFLMGMLWLAAPGLVTLISQEVEPANLYTIGSDLEGGYLAYGQNEAGRVLAGSDLTIAALALAVIAAVLLMVSWGPAADRRPARQILGFPVLLLGVAGLSQIPILILYENPGGGLGPFSGRYWDLLVMVGALIVLAAASYAKSLFVRALGGALVLGWVAVAVDLSQQSGSAALLLGSTEAFVVLAVTWYAISLRARALGGALILGWITVKMISLIISTNVYWPESSDVNFFWIILGYVLLAALIALTVIYVRRPADLAGAAN